MPDKKDNPLSEIKWITFSTSNLSLNSIKLKAIRFCHAYGIQLFHEDIASHKHYLDIYTNVSGLDSVTLWATQLRCYLSSPSTLVNLTAFSKHSHREDNKFYYRITVTNEPIVYEISRESRKAITKIRKALRSHSVDTRYGTNVIWSESENRAIIYPSYQWVGTTDSFDALISEACEDTMKEFPAATITRSYHQPSVVASAGYRHVYDSEPIPEYDYENKTELSLDNEYGSYITTRRTLLSDRK